MKLKIIYQHTTKKHIGQKNVFFSIHHYHLL